MHPCGAQYAKLPWNIPADREMLPAGHLSTGVGVWIASAVAVDAMRSTQAKTMRRTAHHTAEARGTDAERPS